MLLELSDKLLEVLTHQQISGIGWNSTDTDKVKVIMETAMMDDVVETSSLSREEGSNTDVAVLQSDILRKAAFAQVKVDCHNTLARVCKR